MLARGIKGPERGIALITALLMLLLMLSLSLGFALLVASEQRSNGVDLDHTQTFYAAYGAMEQLNAAVGTLFNQTYAPTGAQINAQVTGPTDINGNVTPPVISKMNFYDPWGLGSGYEISFPKDGLGNPKATSGLITQGAYQGFQGLITDYTITVSMQSQNFTLTTGQVGAANQYGSEIRLRRSLQTVAIPVFQFGIFSQTDLSFFPGPNFNFGGVVATNGDLYLATGGTLTLSAQTSAYGDIIRDRLSNGYTGSAYQGTYPGNVSVTTSPGSGNFRNLAYTEGSISGGPSGGCNTTTGNPINSGVTPNTNWTTISISNYNSNLRDGAYGCSRGTGAKNLQLPLVSAGATGIDLIKLPPPNENTTNPSIYGQRYATYPANSNYAMLRIFLADTAGDITQIPEITSAAPVSMTPGVQTVATGSATGDAKYLPPWAMSAGGTYNTVGPCPAAGSKPVYGPNPTKVCNFGDWFTSGLSRLGMGDGITTSSSTTCPDGTPAPAAPSSCGPYIKIEYQDNASGGWVDVTKDILQLGYVGRNISAGNGTVNSVGATAAQVASGSGATCYEPQPDAVIRLQRVTDVPSNYSSSTNKCGYGSTNKYAKLSGGSNALSTDARDYIPQVLFDPREGLLRDCWTTSGSTPPFPGGDCPSSNNLTLAGVMNYVEVDVSNLARWFSGTIGGTAHSGTNVGYLLYISDRRGNQVDNQNGSPETGISCGAGQCKLGNLGWEDFVNPSNANGTPNNSKDTGEDLHGANETKPGGTAVSLTLETYGGRPAYRPTWPLTAPYPLCNSLGAGGCPAGGSTQLVPVANLTNGTAAAGSNLIYPTAGTTSTMSGTSLFTLVSIAEARANPALFFRRAVKLTDAQSFSFGNCAAGATCGLTITSENPVYVEGNYNAPGGNFSGTDTPSAVLADAVTLLSVNWNDIRSYSSPYAYGGRAAATSYYRLAILGGKGVSFPEPTTGSVNYDFGTDGGVHNFLRYVEDWGNQTLNYSGSLVSFFFNEQSVGTYKCCVAVYNPPSRGYNFDTNFLTPSLLPPRTPSFRDINTLGFTQLIMPNQQ